MWARPSEPLRGRSGPQPESSRLHTFGAQSSFTSPKCESDRLLKTEGEVLQQLLQAVYYQSFSLLFQTLVCVKRPDVSKETQDVRVGSISAVSTHAVCFPYFIMKMLQMTIKINKWRILEIQPESFDQSRQHILVNADRESAFVKTNSAILWLKESGMLKCLLPDFCSDCFSRFELRLKSL